MKTIAFAASKGWAGKTTLCAALAVYAARERKVAIVDLDPQGSLTHWRNKRAAQTPELLQARAENLEEVLRQADGYDYVFIDTPPAHMKTIAAGVNNADYVLVPCQPSPVDIQAIGDTLALIEDANKPFAFVLNRLISRTRIGEQAILLLANHGKIAGAPIVQRTSFALAMTDGRTAIEIDGGQNAQADIAALWRFISKHFQENAGTGFP